MAGNTQENYIPSDTELERLFVNNADMNSIEAYTRRFNPIKIMKMERMEIRHSAILSWLLNPSETHGLGDRFLKAFLAQALVGQNRNNKISALDISRSDLHDADVRCEWQNIDIFIWIESKKWGFVIENKVKSQRKDSQLQKYLNRVEKDYKGKKRAKFLGAFLTLQDVELEDSDFAAINYTDVHEILSGIWEQHAHLTSAEIGVFIKHYLEILQEITGMSNKLEDMKELARQLYRENKKVFDFVVEHGVGTEFAAAVRTVFGENTKLGGEVEIRKHWYVFCKLEIKKVSFAPKDWYDKLSKNEWPGCEKWFAGCPLMLWFHISSNDNATDGNLKLFAEVGPLSNYELRNKLISRIKTEFSATKDGKTELVVFQKKAQNEDRKSSRFLKNNREKIKDIHDSDEIAEAMKKLLNKFQPVFYRIETEVLPKFLRDAKTASKDSSTQ